MASEKEKKIYQENLSVAVVTYILYENIYITLWCVAVTS